MRIVIRSSFINSICKRNTLCLYYIPPTIFLNSLTCVLKAFLPTDVNDNQVR